MYAPSRRANVSQSTSDVLVDWGQWPTWVVVVVVVAVVVVAKYKVKLIPLSLTEPWRGAFMSPLCAEH